MEAESWYSSAEDPTEDTLKPAGVVGALSASGRSLGERVEVFPSPLGPAARSSDDRDGSAMKKKRVFTAYANSEERTSTEESLALAEFTVELTQRKDLAPLTTKPRDLRGNDGGPADGHLVHTEPVVYQSYFAYYGKLVNQMNMLQDSVRTTAYRNAIVSNAQEFAGKVVMDVGAGSGILSFFAAEAGAKKVYAVEASSVSEVATNVLRSNATSADVVQVIAQTVETMRPEELPKVDILISEPIGTFLFNERMVETYLLARDKFLKPGGKMFPNKGRLYMAPFTDAALFNDMRSRANFWSSTDCYGMNLQAASSRAVEEQLRQPIIDYIDPSVLVAVANMREFDFKVMPREALAALYFPMRFVIDQTSIVHGIAGWFDIVFDDNQQPSVISTSPWSPPTHWYQIRFLLQQPLALNQGQVLTANVIMVANSQQSYYVKVRAAVDGTPFTSESVVIDLKDPDYRYFTNPSGSYLPPAAGSSAQGHPPPSSQSAVQGGSAGAVSSYAEDAATAAAAAYPYTTAAPPRSPIS